MAEIIGAQRQLDQMKMMAVDAAIRAKHDPMILDGKLVEYDVVKEADKIYKYITKHA